MTKLNPEDQNLIIKLLEPLNDSVMILLRENLDEEICKDISFEYESSSQTKDIQELKTDNVIFRTEYATGQNQGGITLVMPEELMSALADILMGGKGEKEFKGSLSELEINSTSELLNKILKDIEIAFKHSYNQDLAFSSKPEFLTKEMPEFKEFKNERMLDFLVTYNLKLNEDKNYKIKLLLNVENSTKLTIDLGLLKINSSVKKFNVSSLDIDSISDIKINVTAELGRTRVPIKYALELVRGSLIELDTLNNADIKVFANGVEFAYAQIVAIEDNFGLKITKIISPKERLECI